MVIPPMVHKARHKTRLVKWVLILAALLALAACEGGRSQQSLVPVKSLVIRVYQEGFYRLSYKDLEELGVDTSVFEDSASEDRLPLLSNGGVEVPLLPWNDSLIFYGRAPANRYAPYRLYVLDTERRGPIIQSEQRSPVGLEANANVPFAETFEENNFYDGRPYGGLPDDPDRRDPWYWETIQVQSQVSEEFELPRPSSGPATLALELIGVSSNSQVSEDHDLDVFVNGRRLQTVHWDGETAASLEVDIPGGLLIEGANTLLLDNTAPGASPVDIARLDRFTISYMAEPVAIDGRLQTEAVAGTLILAGFRDRPLIFDVSQPDAPLILSGAEFANGQVTIDIDEPARLVAVEPAALLKSQAVSARGPAELAGPANQADFIIISPAAFLPALEPLVANRQAQGISTRQVSLEQIYREFAETGVGPDAISAFVSHAYNNWPSPRPAYLLLVGDATVDYRGYLSQANHPLANEAPLFLPAPIVPVTYSGETVSDARLADVDGDRRPDLAVGRWPVRNVDEVEALVQRTIENEIEQTSPAAIFAADGSEARFADLNERIGQETGLEQERAIYLNGPTNQEFSQVWNQGAWLVTYTGHGSLDRWGKDTLLDTETVSTLQSDGASPIVLQLTCLTGLFAHPTITSLSEAMLLDTNGPVSVVAATSLSLSDSQRPFGVAFLQALQDPNVARVGDAFQRAKEQLDIQSDDALREISDTFTLFGDPTALIPRPGLR